MKSHSQNEGAKTSSSSIANATANGNANVSRKGDGEGYDLTSIHSKANGGGGGGGKSYPTPSSTTSSSSVVHTERPQISILPAPPGYNQRYHKNNLQRTTSNEHASTKLVNGGIRGNDVKERSSSSVIVCSSKIFHRYNARFLEKQKIFIYIGVFGLVIVSRWWWEGKQ